MAFSRDALINRTADLAKIVSQDKFATVIADLREAEIAGQEVGGSAAPMAQSKLDLAKKDAKAFLQNAGVALPEDATASITQNSPITVKVCVSYGDHEVCVTVLA
jgi:hypothetical protein